MTKTTKGSVLKFVLEWILMDWDFFKNVASEKEMIETISAADSDKPQSWKFVLRWHLHSNSCINKIIYVFMKIVLKYFVK